MKLLLLNTTANTGSTGRISEEIGLLAEKKGYDVRFAYGRRAVNSQLPLIKIGNKWDIRVHGVKSRLCDTHGFASKGATKAFIREIEEWKPDIVNIHNIHGYFINVEVLFDYLKRVQIPVVWTFHDCWPFTGHCSYFDGVNCFKWKTECNNCPNIKGYPTSWFVDNSKKNFYRKKELFNGLNNMTIITPSDWLTNHVGSSFLSSYRATTIHNGINLDVFKPVDVSSIYNKYGLSDKKNIILGVASVWDPRKGLTDFIELSGKLSGNEQIVLVGLSEEQSKNLPVNIKGIARTENIMELAALYSIATVFVNPTYLDNFPTTNIEALACGTPVITYRTGGSMEAVDSKTGMIVEQGDVDGLKVAIEEIVTNGEDFYKDDCRERAVRLYNKDDRFKDYIELFERLIKT